MRNAGELRETTCVLVVFANLRGSAEVGVLEEGSFVTLVDARPGSWPEDIFERRFRILTEMGVGWVGEAGMRFTKLTRLNEAR